MNNLSRHSFHSAALVALILLVPARVQADVTEAWVQRYSNTVSNSVDRPFKVLSDSAGDIIVTGTSDNGITRHDILTKYSGSEGSVLWQRRYNGSANGDDSISRRTTQPWRQRCVCGRTRHTLGMALEPPQTDSWSGTEPVNAGDRGVASTARLDLKRNYPTIMKTNRISVRVAGDTHLDEQKI